MLISITKQQLRLMTKILALFTQWMGSHWGKVKAFCFSYKIKEVFRKYFLSSHQIKWAAIQKMYPRTCALSEDSDQPVYLCTVILTLLLLNMTCPVLTNSEDPYQLASEETNWSGSALFVIKYVNFYQKLGLSNLIGWKLEVGMAS